MLSDLVPCPFNESKLNVLLETCQQPSGSLSSLKLYHLQKQLKILIVPKLKSCAHLMPCVPKSHPVNSYPLADVTHLQPPD